LGTESGRAQQCKGEGVGQQFFVTKLYGVLAEAPAALDAYLALSGLLEKTSFSAGEQQVLALAVSVENGCEFCVDAHSFLAHNLVKLDSSTIDALRASARPTNPRHAALAAFARRVVRGRGWVPRAEIEVFLSAGFTKAQVLEVIFAVATKTLTNYANHISQPALNAQFSS
jgi:AhpD family alkylhydroperoxidase